MTIRSVWMALGVLSLAATPPGARAAAVTYDFTATVYSSTGSLGSVQGLITGTLTFDLENAEDALSSGAIGSSSWTRAEHSGSAFQLAPAADYVFSMTASSGSTLLYSTGAPGAYSSESSIQGENGSIYLASDSQVEDPAGLNSRTSSLGLSGQPQESVYDANGRPEFGQAGEFASGSFTTDVNGVAGSVDFGVLSVTPAPVPLPPASGLLVAGLGGLGLLARRRNNGGNPAFATRHSQ
jgi:hypothetical protein